MQNMLMLLYIIFRNILYIDSVSPMELYVRHNYFSESFMSCLIITSVVAQGCRIVFAIVPFCNDP